MHELKDNETDTTRTYSVGNAKGISRCRTVNWHGQEVRQVAEEVDRGKERRFTIEEAARDGVCDKEVCGHLILIGFAKTFCFIAGRGQPGALSRIECSTTADSHAH